MIPGYRYRYPKYSHTEPITDTGFISIYFIPIPIPGIGTWYRYRYRYKYRYRSNSSQYVTRPTISENSSCPESMLLCTEKKRIQTTVSTQQSKKRSEFIRPKNLPKSALNGIYWWKVQILAVFGQYLGRVTSDLFLDCCVETVVRIRFFWVQRSLLFGQLEFWLI